MSRAVVTACNAGYAPGAAGLLRSVRRFHPDVVRYCLAPPSEVTAVQIALGDLAEVRAAPRPVRGVPDQWLMQLLAARVFIPTVPEDVVAWVDCDVVFCRPSDELWEVPAGKVNVIQDAVYNLARMVPADVWPAFARQFGRKPEEPGFNAGIYALRRTDWADLPEKYEAAVADGGYPYYPPGFDQALLNGLMLPRANWLPRAFNAHAVFELGLPPGVRIVHYTDNPKPWMAGYGAHRPGYVQWVEFAENRPGRWRVLGLKVYYSVSAIRRLGFKAVRKVLTKLGVWHHSVGVQGSAT